MAKGVGLDAGEFEVKVVELDGTFRRPRLTKVHIDPVMQVSASAMDPLHASSEASAMQSAVKAAKLQKQNVTLGFPSREALFRQITVPFTGEDRIRKVIKFEAEGEIHSQSVDDMVVDFHVVEEIDDETRVLVAGVPKAALRTTLDALERVGIEPEIVDLDTMALLRIAEWSGALTPDDDLVDSNGGGLKSRLIVDFGARAARVLVVTDGHLHDMRAIPLGADSLAEEVAVRCGLSTVQARAAVAHCLATGRDFDPATMDEGAIDEDEALEGDGEADATTAVRALDVVPHSVVEQARDKYFVRLRREFMRFAVSVKGMGDIEAAFTTGAGSLLPGLHELLGEVFECEPSPLLYMELLQHDLEEDEVREYEPRIAVAVGLALGQMGGVAGFNFRQEELVYTRGFDRMKLPLAIASMLSLFALVVYGMVLHRRLDQKEQLYGFAVERQAGKQTRRQKVKGGSYMQYTGYLGYLVNRTGWPGKRMKHDEYRKLVNDLAELPVFSRIRAYRNRLTQYLRKVQRDGEYDPKLALPSGASVLQQFGRMIKELEDSLGRFYVSNINLQLPRGTKRDNGRLEFEIFFRGADFAERKRMVEARLESLYTDKKSAFLGKEKPPRETTFPAENSASYQFHVKLKENIPVIKDGKGKP